MERPVANPPTTDGALLARLARVLHEMGLSCGCQDEVERTLAAFAESRPGTHAAACSALRGSARGCYGATWHVFQTLKVKPPRTFRPKRSPSSLTCSG